jgi:hypothetical protein
MADSDKEKLIGQITDFRVFMAETVIYRKDQSSRMDRMAAKMDKIFERLEGLPCKERAYIPIHVNAIWGFIGAIVLILISGYIKKGS